MKNGQNMMNNEEGIHFKEKLFGGEIEVILYGLNNIKANEIMSKFYSEALRLQKIFNFFDTESELSKLNKMRKMKVSKELLEVLNKSLELSKLTHGDYDVSIGKEISERKNHENVNKINVSYKDIKISGDKIILKKKDVLIDLGSIAKGYITDKLGDFLKSHGVGEFLIDARGDILCSGNYEHVIGVQNPREEKENVNLIKIKNQAVATSGDYKQFDKNYENSHIINQKNIISVTVVAPTLEEADVFSTAIFVSSEKDRKKILKKNKNIKVLTLDKELNKEMFNRFEELIYKDE